MAELVLGLATSHSPLLSTPPEHWGLRAKADRANPQHHFRGRVYDFDTLIWERAPGFANQTTIDVRRERYERCQRALDELARKFNEVAPDAVIIVGNDQREIFSDSLTPAITVYRGERIENIPFTKEEPRPGLAIAEHGNCPVGGATYPGAPELADHSLNPSSRMISTSRSRLPYPERYCVPAFPTPTVSYITGYLEMPHRLAFLSFLTFITHQTVRCSAAALP